ncbi:MULTISPECIES: hypothetical protein [Arthrobacter]|uniref:hypothetical protein n=1 Tax=Arthrobacter TaxID=1663 RepID=UPI00197A9572|nr:MULTISPECIES: hypothetical protein [Arthrobacter]MBT8163583.1 hypothetical protein [Arthrobacter sp. GN70]
MALLSTVRDKLGIPATKNEPAETESAEQAAPSKYSYTSSQDAAKTLAAFPPDEEPDPKPNWWRRREARAFEGMFENYPHLMALKPKERYLFRSDYFQVDGSVGCVLAFVHDIAAQDGFPAFWGIGRIPEGLGERVTAVLLEQVERKGEKWIDQYTKQSERISKLDSDEQEQTGTNRSIRKAQKIAGNIDVITAEIQDGASYLSVQNRLLLKAPDLPTLEESIERIERLYIDRFGTLKVAAYHGEQRQELAGLLKQNDKKRGNGFHFTSTELAGSYSLVTNGLNDPAGEYVGYMVGDVNNSAVLFDVNGYDHHVVIADGAIADRGNYNEQLDRQHIANLWCSKLSQACMLDNGSVVHLVLDDADLDRLGPKFDRLTARVDLNAGDVNPFEMFGDETDELSIFPAQLQKLVLMFEQLYEAGDAGVGSIIRNELEKTATQFYVDRRMWYRNAKANRHRLRVVGIPHEQVPRLQMFVSYLETAHTTLLNSSKNDPDQLRAYNVLKGVAKNLLDNNGDLFNNHTSTAVDGIRDARRVIYDFSRLMRRGKGVAMAQLVNIVGFAIGTLQRGDTVIIHGAENIDGRVKSYLTTQFEHLHARGGRVVFSYNNTDRMLADARFNGFAGADYTIFGAMLENTVTDYQQQLHQRIPPDLVRLITRRGENLSYLRRGHSNVVFHLDLALGISPRREKQRRELERGSRLAEHAEKYAVIRGNDRLEPGANLTGDGTSNQERVEKAVPKGATMVPAKATRRTGARHDA